MRAIQMKEFGGPEVLRLAELPRPQPGPGEAVIKVTRAGLNFADTHTRTNSYVQKATLPLVPGGEVAGVLDGGERVVALVGTGGYAEYATAPLERIFPIPEGVEDGTALALVIQGTTAWHLLRTAGRLTQGESVVVHSAAGGVGSLATQLAKAFGAGRVIASASSAQKRELALSLGADAAIEAAPEGLTERLLEANEGRGLDVVLDSSGGAVFDASIKALAPFGRIVVNGIATSEQNEVRTGSLLRHSRAVIGFWLFHCLPAPGRAEAPVMFATALEDLFVRASRGELRAIVGETYPLERAAEAQSDLRERRTTGKLLLDVTA
ncbi:MAG: quinone oxidoreductase family protein [Solirubrobacteraceae bacterium]